MGETRISENISPEQNPLKLRGKDLIPFYGLLFSYPGRNQGSDKLIFYKAMEGVLIIYNAVWSTLLSVMTAEGLEKLLHK